MKENTDFQKFLGLFAEYLEYLFVPKGSAVFHFGNHLILKISTNHVLKGELGEEFYVIMQGEAHVFIQKNDLEIIAGSKDTSKIETYYDLQTFFKNHSELDRTIILDTDTKWAYASEIDISSLTADERLLYCAEDSSFKYYKNGVCHFKSINSLSTGDGFGELALIYNKERAASIVARTDLYLTKIHRENYKKIFDMSIKTVESKAAFLASLFPSISKETLARLCYCVQEKPLSMHKTIYTQGSSADALYILRAGEVKVNTSNWILHMIFVELKAVLRQCPAER